MVPDKNLEPLCGCKHICICTLTQYAHTLSNMHTHVHVHTHKWENRIKYISKLQDITAKKVAEDKHPPTHKS